MHLEKINDEFGSDSARRAVLAVLSNHPGEMPPQPGVIPQRVPSRPDQLEEPSVAPTPRPVWVPRVPGPGQKSPWEQEPTRRIGF